jgi:hypothetical protein
MPALFSVTPSVAIDALDVVVIAPRGANCTATLSTGQQVPIDVDPATLADGCDSAAGISSGSMFAGPFDAVEWPAPVYIAGAAVRSIRSTPNGLGCALQFGASPGFLTVPNVTRGAMVDLLNACAVPGPAANAANAGTADGSSLIIGNLTNVTTAELQRIYWSFVPDEGSETEGTVTARVYGDCITTAPGAGSFDAVGLAANGLPYPIDDTTEAVMQVTQSGAGATVTMYGQNGKLSFAVVGVDGLPIVFSGVLVYRTGAE